MRGAGGGGGGEGDKRTMVNRSLLARATSSDSTPTPGYLYGEIARMTHSNPEECSQVAAYLLKKLQKPSGTVKLKVLNVIKHVCLKGRKDFKRAVQLRIQDVKECLSFTGPPDPLCGDEIYVMVKEAAKEAIQAVYSDDSVGVTAKPAFESRIRGFGNIGVKDSSTHVGDSHNGAAFNEGGYTESSTMIGANGMVGIGNGDPVSTRKTWFNSASDSIKSTASAAASAVESRVKHFRQSKHDIQDNYVGGMDGFGDTTVNDCVSNRGPTPYWMTNGQGIGSPSGTNFCPPVVGGGSGTQFQQQQQQPGNYIGKEENGAWPGTNSHHDISSIALRAKSSDEYLDNAVATVCAHGGTRAVPSKDKLDAFMVKTACLDQPKVQDALLKLAENAEDDYRVQSKALSVLIFLIEGERRTQRDKLPVNNENSNKIESRLMRICEHAKAPVREKSAELLRLLGRNALVSKGNTQREGGTIVSVSPNLLLGDFEDTKIPQPTILQESSDHGGPEDYVDLFDNMVVKEPAAMNNQQPTTTSGTSCFPFMVINPVVDIFEDTATSNTTPSSSSSSSSGSNVQSLGLDFGMVTATMTKNPVDLISDQPISSTEYGTTITTANWDGLDPFHDRPASLVCTEIPIKAQVQTTPFLKPKPGKQNKDETATQLTLVPATNVGAQQGQSLIAMHQQRMPLPGVNSNTMQQHQQQMLVMMMQQPQNQYQNMAIQQPHQQRKVQNNNEMHIRNGTSFTSVSRKGGGNMQNSPPIELDHDEFSFVRDAMKLEGE